MFYFCLHNLWKILYTGTVNKDMSSYFFKFSENTFSLTEISIMEIVF